jgi:hypothetical protein
MFEARKWSNAFLTYCGVAAALVICSSLSLAFVINAGAGLSQTAEIEKHCSIIVSKVPVKSGKRSRSRSRGLSRWDPSPPS